MQANSQKHLPKFSAIDTKLIEMQLDSLLHRNKDKISRLLKQPIFEWDNFLRPLQEFEEELSNFWAPISHLNSVKNTDQMRAAYNACIPKLTAYYTELAQNEALYKAYQKLSKSEHFENYSTAQKQSVHHALRNFKLAGVGLDAKKKKLFAELQQKLAALTTKFEENILDATQHWFYHTTDESEVSGLPKTALKSAKDQAKKRDLDGWVITLDFPIYYAVMSHADNIKLRETVYTAYVTRASDQCPDAEKYDNSSVMTEILTCRKKLAELLGFKHYAEYSLVTKMADSTKTVIDFLENLANRSKPLAEKEFAELKAFAKSNGAETLNSWDVLYYSEKLKHQLFNLNQEILRDYFPEEHVIQALFSIAEKLYDIQFKPVKEFDTWHEDVQCFSVCDKHGSLLAFLYMDLYTRDKKRGGAWMAECRNRYRRIDGSIQLPVAFLNCNFTPASKESPSCLTHDEVITLFHEFGHCLQHILTTVDVAAVSGINGVEWDAVELASQIHENWCWEKESILMISHHVKTREPLPEKLLQQLIDAKNFQSGLQLLRQLEFSLFDFKLHLTTEKPTPDSIQSLLNDVRKTVAVVKPPKFNRFQHGFSHIFAGGYAAGYYSYKWAELLSSDAFSLFEENGIFDKKTGQRLLETILQPGSSKDAMTLFVEFRGRKPKIDALLRHSGITK